MSFCQDFGRLHPPVVSQVDDKVFTIPIEARHEAVCLRWIQKSLTGEVKAASFYLLPYSFVCLFFPT